MHHTLVHQIGIAELLAKVISGRCLALSTDAVAQ